MNVPILETRNLHYRYPDGTQALQGVTLGIRRQETVAVLGGNGAGKSTLFLCCNGLLKPAAGQVLYRGVTVEYTHQGLTELRRRIGIVFQDPDNQVFSASVSQDISFGLVNLKLPETEIRKRVGAIMERMRIAHLKDKPTHCLSFGQKKRVAIAGVLAMEPEVLVLDEPTAGLDPMGVSELLHLLGEIQAELGIAIVLATHDVDLVPLYCNSVYVLNEGKIVLEGTPAEVFAAKDALRSVQLRLPRIGHLMEILKEKDGFELTEASFTISQARQALKQWNALKQQHQK